MTSETMAAPQSNQRAANARLAMAVQTRAAARLAISAGGTSPDLR